LRLVYAESFTKNNRQKRRAEMTKVFRPRGVAGEEKKEKSEKLAGRARFHRTNEIIARAQLRSRFIVRSTDAIAALDHRKEKKGTLDLIDGQTDGRRSFSRVVRNASARSLRERSKRSILIISDISIFCLLLFTDFDDDSTSISVFAIDPLETHHRWMHSRCFPRKETPSTSRC